MRKYLLLMILSIIFMIGMREKNYYTIDAQVTAKSGTFTTVRDSEGYDWCLFSDDLQVNDKIKMKMFDKNTEQIYDDEIVKFSKIK